MMNRFAADSEIAELHRLARDLGVQYRYVDGLQGERAAGPDSIIASLNAMGYSISRLDQAKHVRRSLRKQRLTRVCEPVVVAWDGKPATMAIRIGATAPKVARLRIKLEDGGSITRDVKFRGDDIQPGVARFLLPRRLPLGAHSVVVEFGSAIANAIVLAAPYRFPQMNSGRALGLFTPLYALRTQQNWGAGDLRDLDLLGDWWHEAVGDSIPLVLGTLPLLSTFLDRPFDPSPYAPVSRLFWNEFFLDIESAPDLTESPRALRAINSTEFQSKIAQQRRRDLVDYRAVYALKRQILDALAVAAFNSPRRRAVIERFVQHTPHALEYAAFRSAVERTHRAWPTWKGRIRVNDTLEFAGRDRAARTHLYAQFLMHEQMSSMRRRVGDRWSLYLDYPIGVHGGGFDTWRFRDLFVHDLSVGAPPDALFTRGQNWGFPPLHPERSRADGHAYFRSCLRNLCKFAPLLRIDHVMGLHRLFCIPPGFAGNEGVYIAQPVDEMYAALSIEAHRSGTVIVGENLGTVPPQVNRELRRRGILGMHVQQFSFHVPSGRAGRSKSRVCIPPKPDTLASLNTHDTPLFASFWRGEDIHLRRRLKLISPAEGKREHASRTRLRRAIVRELQQLVIQHRARPKDIDVLHALHTWLSARPARIDLLTMEDFWLETRPQNTPGVSNDVAAKLGVPNWQRKHARMLQEIFSDATLAAHLRSLGDLRRA